MLTDCKNHASLLDGCRLSRADVRTYSTATRRQLGQLLSRPAGHRRRRLIVADSLFSMDGDLAPLAELADLADRHGAMLMVDEAHATGVFGPRGRGLAEQLGLDQRIPIRVGTLSKAVAIVGRLRRGSRSLVEWLVNRTRPYVFSTAMPSPLAAAALAALEIIRDEAAPPRGAPGPGRRLRPRSGRQGWNLGRSASQIIPLVVGQRIGPCV